MSAEFVKLISELHDERYSVQLRAVIEQKIPCGAFYGFFLPDNENFEQSTISLRNAGFNLTCFCVVGDKQKAILEDKLKNVSPSVAVIKVEDLRVTQSKPAILLYNDGFKPLSFRNYFLSCGVDMFPAPTTNNVEYGFDVHMHYLPELYKVHEMLADEESKKVFRAYIKGRVTNRIKDFRFAAEPQYFLEGFLPNKGDIAIDGGSFDGATSRDFAMRGAKVYAFELSKENYQNCLPCAKKYNFTIENFGLSDKLDEGYYLEGIGEGCRKLDGGGGDIGNFTDLDSYVLRKDLPRVDYIKLDIEGSELAMLHGAFKTISSFKPKMAVSAYHRTEDLWTLATYIKSIRPDYEFQFRHYRIDCTDYLLNDAERKILDTVGEDYFLPNACESVLYCR